MELGKGLEPDETGSSGGEQGQLACCCHGVGGMFGRRVGSGEVGSSERHHRTVVGLEGGLPLQRWQGGLLDCLPAH